jgi:MerR family transcriptional regulator, light-induced transcriptional regulator
MGRLEGRGKFAFRPKWVGEPGMASVYEIVRSFARGSSPVPILRSIVGRKAPSPPPPGFTAIVAREIIPRLVVAHAPGEIVHAEPTGDSAAISAQEATTFAPLALDHDACALLDHIEIFLDRGVCVDAIFVDLLAPAARHLGVMWEEDDADFIAVTMALWRLQEVVRELSSRVPVRRFDSDHPMRALFSIMPGEQHSFGTVMIEDMFRRAGWETMILTQTDRSQLLAIVATHEFDLIGLTVTGDSYSETVPSVINGLRSVSRNPHVAIMVGGRIFTEKPDRAMAVGADATARDATHALEVARTLVEGAVARSEICA